MPSNGDGSSDNGPIEGHEIVHGTSGDTTLQHTKHVAPMPEIEAGDSLPGLGAGGVADVVQGDSEEFGTNEPKKDPLDDTVDETANIPLPERDSSSRPGAPKRQKTGDVDVSGSSKASSDYKSKPKSGGAQASDLEQVSRHKAEKYIALDKDEVAMSSAGSEAGKREARAGHRADALQEPKDKGKADKHGSHADVEALHGEADSRKGGSDADTGKGGSAKGAGKDGGKSGKGDLNAGNDLEKVQRHQAEKFGAVNLENE